MSPDRTAAPSSPRRLAALLACAAVLGAGMVPAGVAQAVPPTQAKEQKKAEPTFAPDGRKNR